MFNENLEPWSSQDGEGTYGICCINLIIASVSQFSFKMTENIFPQFCNQLWRYKYWRIILRDISLLIYWTYNKTSNLFFFSIRFSFFNGNVINGHYTGLVNEQTDEGYILSAKYLFLVDVTRSTKWCRMAGLLNIQFLLFSYSEALNTGHPNKDEEKRSPW